MKVLFAWSTGKDSAQALLSVLQDGTLEVAALLTTVVEEYNRVGMHGVREDLLEEQAAAIGLPLEKVFIPRSSTNEIYEQRMKETLVHWKDRGIGAVVFGDLFLEDLRKYREAKMKEVGMEAIFPLWNQDTTSLARRFSQAGFRAVITCVDTHAIPCGLAGAEFDEGFLAALPAGVDPCGENGEFHSFVYEGPTFSRPVPFLRGERVMREDRFCYVDLVPHRCSLSASGRDHSGSGAAGAR